MRTRRGTRLSGCKSCACNHCASVPPVFLSLEPAQYWSRARRGQIAALGSLQGLVEVANPKLVMNKRDPSRAWQVKVAQKCQLSYSITVISVYSVQIRFRPSFPYSLPCHQFSVLSVKLIFLLTWMVGVPVSHFHGSLHLSLSLIPSPTLIYKNIEQLPANPCWKASVPSAIHGTQKWLTVPESALQKTLNLGVRDSNPDCCSQVYPETGRKAIYLVDLKLAPRSHQWGPVRLLYSDSALKNCFIHWANISSS